MPEGSTNSLQKYAKSTEKSVAMRIVIDMQGLQSMSRYRGIGSYTRSFVRAFLSIAAEEHDIYLLFNGAQNMGAYEIMDEFSQLVAREKMAVFSAVAPCSVLSSEDGWNLSVSEKLREEFIHKIDPDWVLITSLFEGVEDNSVISIGEWREMPTAVIFYDLIPLLYPEKFLAWEPMKRWYMRKLEYLKRADLLLCISESAAREAKIYLGKEAPPLRVVSSAVSERFRPAAVRSCVLERFGIEGAYIMLASAYEKRKNFEGLIEAYALLPRELIERYSLVLLSRIPLEKLGRLQRRIGELRLSGRVIFTGYVSDEEMLELYRGASLFVFPSFHEGFGLPPLEAMSCAVPTIVSDRSSMPEVVGRQDMLFDPYSVEEMSQKMARVLLDESFKESIVKHGLERAAEFSWHRSAQRALAALLESTPRTKMRSGHMPPYDRAMILESEAMEAPSRRSLAGALRAAVRNEADILGEPLRRKSPLKWRIEGPFDSSYSLALLNRESARAMLSLGVEVSLHSREGGGSFEADRDFLRRNPDLARLYRASRSMQHASADVVSRNLYPPKVEDMSAYVNMLHHYAWEESGFPLEWVDEFNDSLDTVTTLSTHVRKILIDHGVTVPVSVSGCGVDHWERVQASKEEILPRNLPKVKILHVSSCFPRKGVDCLLRAYVEAFSAEDDVTLIIKTFDNPHNEIESWIEEATRGIKRPPHIFLIKKDLREEELKRLYLECDILAAPSRAEGFGLPIAEAMLSGLAVLTSAWGGQRDFCDDETAWLVDYDFAYADTHFRLFDSVWAEPRQEHLTALLKELVRMDAQERKRRSMKGRERLLEKFRWVECSRRLIEAAFTLPKPFPPQPGKTGWVSSWNSRCGIADYSAQLIASMPQRPMIFAAYSDEPTAEDGPEVRRCWSVGDDCDLSLLKRRIAESGMQIVVIQFNYGFFGFRAFAELLAFLRREGIVRVLMMHSTTDSPLTPHKRLQELLPELKECERILVHTPNDMNRLKSLGLVENVTLFPHGIPLFDAPKRAAAEVPLLMSYGFALPHKGLPQLLEAAHILRKRGLAFRLEMMNARYPLDISREVLDTLHTMVESLGLGEYVRVVDEFLPERETLKRLSGASLVLFPYQESGESSSAAVRYALAANAPVAVTPLNIFDDLRGAVFRLPGTDARSLADGIEEILSSMERMDEKASKVLEEADRWREAHRYDRIGKRLYNILISLMENGA